MKIPARIIFLFVAFAAGTAFADVPRVNVTVSNSGKASFKGVTDPKGTFATPKLGAGNYVVQFNSNSADLKGKKFAVVVSAGKKKVTADVAGEKFAGGGVAMKVDVAAGLNVTGQLAVETGPVSKDGKKMVWIPKQLNSNMPGHWVEEGSAEAKAAQSAGGMSRERVQSLQEHAHSPGGN
jgi:hypothetical protein